MNAITREAAQDPQVRAAMDRIAEAVADLYQALDDLATTTPRLGPALLRLLGPDLCAQAAQVGRDAHNIRRSN